MHNPETPMDEILASIKAIISNERGQGLGHRRRQEGGASGGGPPTEQLAPPSGDPGLETPGVGAEGEKGPESSMSLLSQPSLDPSGLVDVPLKHSNHSVPFSSGSLGATARPAGSLPPIPSSILRKASPESLPGSDAAVDPRGAPLHTAPLLSPDAFHEAKRHLKRMQQHEGERAPTASPSHEALEAIVRESLKPLLKKWLETHLPPMVERLVREEIERLRGD